MPERSSTRPWGPFWRRSTSRVAAALLLLCACLRQAPPPDPHASPAERAPATGEAAVVAWVDRHLVPLESSDPAARSDDLRALDPFVRDRRVVALGEATHGTREFFRLKHRLFRHLVEHHGYTVLAIELPHAAAARIDEYIQGAAADPRALLEGSYWFLDAEELLELITWMRQHNAKVARDARLELVGFDIQRPRESALALASIVAHALPGASARHGELLARMAESEGELPKGEALEPLVTQLDRLRTELQGKPRIDARALQHLEVLAQNLDILRHCGDAFGCQVTKRDLFMAQNVLRQLEGTSTRAVVWAHNGHVGHGIHPDGWRPMGHHLRAALGDGLLVVGFEFDHGGFVAPAGGVGKVARAQALPHLGGFEVAEYILAPSPPGSLAHMLAQARVPMYFLPLAHVGTEPEIAAWFHDHRQRHEYGAFAPSQTRHHVDQLPLPASFDALIFVEETRGYTFLGEAKPAAPP